MRWMASNSPTMKRKKGLMKGVAKYYEEILWCMKCGRTDLPLHLAHKENRSQGGEDTIENVRKLCIDCHLSGDHGWKIKSYLGRKI